MLAAALPGCDDGNDPSDRNLGATAIRPDFTGLWGTYAEAGRQEFASIDELPLRPQARRKIDAYLALVAPGGDTPGGFCLGYGMPGSMLGSGGYPMEIVQHDELIVVIYEAHAEIRHIYLGEAVAEEDLFADRNGYSIGRWDGPTLVVTTTHLKEALDQRQFPHSADARIVERYSLSTSTDGIDILAVEMTLTDPQFYTEPVTAQKQWAYRPGGRLLSYECNEPAWQEHLDSLARSVQVQ